METYVILPSGDNQADLIGVYPCSIFNAFVHIYYSDKTEGMLDILVYKTFVLIFYRPFL